MVMKIYSFIFVMWILILIGGGIVVKLVGPISLVRLLIAKNPLSEKQISNEVLKLTMFSGVLAVITTFMMGVKI